MPCYDLTCFFEQFKCFYTFQSYDLNDDKPGDIMFLKKTNVGKKVSCLKDEIKIKNIIMLQTLK